MRALASLRSRAGRCPSRQQGTARYCIFPITLSSAPSLPGALSPHRSARIPPLHPSGKQKNPGKGWGVGKAHKGEVTKSGFLARFPLEGEVWPALCVWTAWEGTHTQPSDGRTSAWPAAKEPDARPRLSAMGAVAGLGIQWYYLKPTTAAETRNASCPCLAAQTVRLPTAFGHTQPHSAARLGV